MVDGSDARAGTTEEPERLFSCDPELARIRELLDRDDPPDGAAERVLAKVGGPARPPEGGRPWSIPLKLSLLAGVALLALASSEIALTSRPMVVSPGPSVPATPATSADPAPSAPDARNVESARIETVRIEDLPRAAARAASPAASATDPFVLELALVEQARAALARGRGRECLDVIARYAKSFSDKGQFKEEIEVMRIEALAMTSERAQAHARAARFLEQHGETAYAERLHRVLQETAGEP